MICPNCGSGQTAIVDSRESGWGGETVRRRRRCRECGFRYSTFEITEESYNGLLKQQEMLREIVQNRGPKMAMALLDAVQEIDATVRWIMDGYK